VYSKNGANFSKDLRVLYPKGQFDMMMKTTLFARRHQPKSFWLGLSCVNLALVALMGFLLRSKILFPLPFINYKNLLNAHSHLAFSGWVGLALMTFFIYDILPGGYAEKRTYQRILWWVEITSLGMLVSFPFQGYAGFSILFSTLFIFTTYAFGWQFFRDAKKANVQGPVRWLSVAAIAALLLSSIGPYALAYMMVTKSTNALLHRDAIYTFLHLQYNGFFTLGIFALYFHGLAKKGVELTKSMRLFSGFLIASVVPSLFLSLLWHNLAVFYALAVTGCVLILLTLVYCAGVFWPGWKDGFFRHPLARLFWAASFVSFVLKSVLTVGTIYTPLGNAVYGARPVIIGFLHLVFLGFVSFFLLSRVLEQGMFTQGGKRIVLPFYIFGGGIVANELLLMLQGLEVLFKTNNPMYNWYLWIAAIILFMGAAAIALAHYGKKKATASEP
jgi:hypothetical protein